MDFVPILGMLTLIIAIINLVKYVTSKDTNGIITTVSVWLAGVVVVLLVGNTDFADTIVIADRAMSDYNFWSLVFIGLTISAMSQFAVDIKKAVDRTDSAVKPEITGGYENRVPVEHNVHG